MNSDSGRGPPNIVTPRLVTYLAPVSQVALGANGNGLAIASASSSYVAVPDVRGDDLATATTVLERARLQVGTVSYAAVCGKPGGHVIDQAPEAVVSGIVTMRPVLSGVSLTIGRHVECPPVPVAVGGQRDCRRREEGGRVKLRGWRCLCNDRGGIAIADTRAGADKANKPVASGVRSRAAR